MYVPIQASSKKGVFANIMMKTGLNFILSTDECVHVLEKATLLSVILGMVSTE